MLFKFFEWLTVAADVSQFVSLKKTFDNHDQLQLMHRLDEQDDMLYNTLLKNQELMIQILGGMLMYIKDMKDRIVEKGNKQDMSCLGDMLVDLIEDLKDKAPIKYKHITYKLHKLAYGEHLTEDEAKYWVYAMENKDGSKGEHWTYAQTEDVRKQYAPMTDPCDFYAVLNMMYSDYYNVSFDTSIYIDLAKDWINDKDVGQDKTLKYYLFIVK